ncbi:HOOK-domain-containing protein, partial [Schizopora paradoxa]
MMSSSHSSERDAFLALLATFDLEHPVHALSDLSDGSALFSILKVIDPEYFQPARSGSLPDDNWVLRFSALKRLYRLMAQYLADVLHQPTTGLDVPDLQAMAKEHDTNATLTMCRLALVIAVQSEKNKMIIEKIQRMNEEDQHVLMKAIEQVMTEYVCSIKCNCSLIDHSNRDDHYYALQSERSRIFVEKETLENVYKNLLEEHRTLQTTHDDTVAEKEDALSRLRDMQRDLDVKRNDRSDGLMRAEIDRLRADLQKSEDNLNATELELDKKDRLVTDLEHKVEELQGKADEAARLKDQLDEYRHAADKLQKTENVMEKYKKKLEESADLRKKLKALEEENSSLVDKNAALEGEMKKVSSYKPLLESYKHQISEMETRNSSRSKEIDTLKFELDQTRTLLRIADEERAKDSETIDLFQERIRELELTTLRSEKSIASPNTNNPPGDSTEFTEAELTGHSPDDADRGLGAELDDAESGRTMTKLKIELRQVKAELASAKSNQNNNSDILVLQSLLDDSNRLKARYEEENLSVHRENLVLQKNLEDIRSGKALGDGSEAAIALRQRLNETVDQLDTLRKEHAELEVNFKSQSNELVIAKSDLNLVNKDQLDILANLRESVKGDKAELESDIEKLRQQVKELSDKNKMQLEQINGLLMEKVTLQSDGIGQRERMLERERNFSNLRLSVNSKDIPEDVKQRLLKLHEDNIQLQEQLNVSQEKLAKARKFIKSQDKQFKAEHVRSNAGSPRILGDLDISMDSQVKIRDEEIERLKKQMQQLTGRYQKEQQLLQGVIVSLGAERAQGNLSTSRQTNAPPRSWLARQRNSV